MRYLFPLSIVLFLYGAYNMWSHRTIRHEPSILVQEEPHQNLLTSKRKLKYKNAELELLAEYKIKARVLSVELYKFDPTAEVAPIDLALGWQTMSDTAVIDKLNIRQAVRYYSYSWRGEAPASPEEITRTSANTHIVPATPEIEKRVKKLRVGQIVTLQGYLVAVHFNSGGPPWTSSLIRTDTGNGACEIMYVDSILD